MIPFTIPAFLNNRVMLYIIGVLCIISLMFYIHIRAHSKGYKAGVEVTEARYNKEKMEWFTQVTQLKQDHENTVNGILTSYNGMIAELEGEINKLQHKDPIIRTRYIERYVPIEVNCTIPKGFVELHNTSAQGKVLVDAPNNPMESTNTTLQDVGSTVAINYYEYNKIAEQLRSLQNVVKDFQMKQKELIQ